eukprot:CAMPEP_0194534612 /NCGR_PEP_ID=MMETSP0253-20130528/72881_1 /TAXON_ID=2966 /ORGANISM="Noctiluca scintillans" /LENGTH=91 /DNA_ID=CAMNT_0039380299 /DNA_START=126 /DNA_END=401 /DNA_ORIENTATION=+
MSNRYCRSLDEEAEEIPLDSEKQVRDDILAEVYGQVWEEGAPCLAEEENDDSLTSAWEVIKNTAESSDEEDAEAEVSDHQLKEVLRAGSSR